MAFEYRFNVIRFYSKLNRFVLSPRKKPNHFVLKIRPGGFADYIWKIYFHAMETSLSCNGIRTTFPTEIFFIPVEEGFLFDIVLTEQIAYV